MIQPLVLATQNPDKVAEIRELLAGTGMVVQSLMDFPDAPEVEEDGGSFEENAIKKARAIVQATGLPALADDSGLEVEALDGAPGVHSARFAGDHASYGENNRKLLERLEDVPDEQRTARFRCVLALACPDGAIRTFEGVCEGQITHSPRGQGGFGYDPLFLVPSLGKTFGEISRKEKSAISHRGRALQQLKAHIRAAREAHDHHGR